MTKKDQIIELLDSGKYSDSDSETADISDEVECSRDYVRQVKRDYRSDDSESDPEDSGEDGSEDDGSDGEPEDSGEDDPEDDGESDVEEGSDGDSEWSDYDSVEDFKNSDHNCGNCGAEVKFGITFCPECGTNLEKGFAKALQVAKNKIGDDE